MKKIALLLTIACCLFACKKDNANFILADAKTCFETSITDSLSLEQTIIGEWELVHFECGPCQANISASGRIIFNKEESQLNIREDDIIYSQAFTWVIEPIAEFFKYPPSYTFHIVTEPYLIPTGNFHKICEEYLEHDSRANDGNYYLFKKL